MSQHRPYAGTVHVAFVDRRKATAKSIPDSSADLATPANYATNGTLDTRLNTISSTTYTQKILDQMTQNDKVFAMRCNDDSGSL